MKKFIYGIAAVGLLVAFQNCSNGASFQSAGELVAKTDVATDGTSGINTGDGGPAASPTPTPTTPPPTMATPPPTTSYPPTPTPPSTKYPPTHGNDDTPKYPPGTVPPGHSSHDDCPGHDHSRSTHSSVQGFVCVLHGNGNSVKVGLVNKALVGKVGTPSDVCMSENACLNIMSKKFDVKGPERRGFCPDKNPHVVPMTDAEIEASLAETEVIQSTNPTKVFGH